MFQRARTALVAALVLLMGSSPPSLAQDEAAVVEGLTSARGEAPLPKVGRGAANHSPEQTAHGAKLRARGSACAPSAAWAQNSAVPC